jgi:mannose-6-phosphate isomerase-like protein (cupin superfamily)
MFVLWRFAPALGATLFVTLTLSAGSERQVDPTFLYRPLSEVSPKPSDLTTPTCRYKPLFGVGDSETSIVKGVARYGEMTVDPSGHSATVNYPAEEQVYFVLEGKGSLIYGNQQVTFEQEDFAYLPPGIDHGVRNSSERPLRVVVMGFRIPEEEQPERPSKLLLANASQAEKQVVGGHPPTTLFQLLIGDVNSTRDLIAAGHLLTSLFIMEFAPGGTNHPHHHPSEEEIYLVLDGRGEIVAGGGLDGIEGRHPATAGDVYFFRLNCTVGFYSETDATAPKARILAVRSRYP